VTERSSAARVGLDECGVETCDPVWLQAVASPVIERGAESRSLLGVELHMPARSDLETLANRLRPLGKGELPEQDVAIAPRDLDDLARDVDQHPTRPARFHRERAYTGASA
jgi:hypothetical protein